jgi:DNA-binding NtrC family response regulator
MTPTGGSLKSPSSVPPDRASILFADDEAILREIALAALERAGYRVLIASSADEAAGFIEADRTIAIAILDWSMPGASGAALLARVRSSRPDLPIVISSGAIDDAVRALESADAAIRLLQKPWRARILVELVASLLA